MVFSLPPACFRLLKHALCFNHNKTLWSVHFGVVAVELINCKRGGIVKNEIW